MRGYLELTAEPEIDALERRMEGFHDALLKELQVVNRAWVNADRSMPLDDRFDLRLLVQSQGQLRALDLLAIGVRSLVLGASGESLSGSIALRRIDRPVERLEFTLTIGEARLVCDRLFVAERPDWHGPDARFRGLVPSPDAVPARDLGHGCRQCSVCATAFDAADRGPFVACPGCGRLTEATA